MFAESVPRAIMVAFLVISWIKNEIIFSRRRVINKIRNFQLYFLQPVTFYGFLTFFATTKFPPLVEIALKIAGTPISLRPQTGRRRFNWILQKYAQPVALVRRFRPR